MKKNGVSTAKAAVNLAKKNAKKAQKQEKKVAKKAEKRERKDIKSAYMKALRKGNTDRTLAGIAVLLAVIPVALQFVVELLDKKGSSKK